jgi:hypothetical protein
MKVYHGSYIEITEIDLSKCETTKLYLKPWQEIYELLKSELD